MRKHNTGVNKVKQRPKYNELKAVYEYLQNNIASATIVATALNIYRPNLSLRKRKLEISGLLVVVTKGYCKLTKRWVQFFTTNPAWMSINSQLKLF